MSFSGGNPSSSSAHALIVVVVVVARCDVDRGGGVRAVGGVGVVV